ncbi:MAG: hypothetical protein K0M69_15735 [Youngiibacter sp.]|nr:hypothetical protein [Youngiibacter sp.]
MSKFQFKDRSLTLNIAGHEFALDASASSFYTEIRAVGQSCVDKAAELKDKPATIEMLNETTQFILEAIDGILGAGASDKIFETRTKDMFDAIDVLGYIIEEAQALNKARIDERVAKYSPNRAQRRGGKK